MHKAVKIYLIFTSLVCMGVIITSAILLLSDREVTRWAVLSVAGIAAFTQAIIISLFLTNKN